MRTPKLSASHAKRCAVLALTALVCAACSHDLAKLRKGTGSAGSSSSGSGGSSAGTSAGSSAGSSGSAGSAGSSGSGAGTSGALDSCKPCAQPPVVVGSILKGESCCTGSRGSKCGTTFDSGAHCFARNVPGSSDSLCQDWMHLGKTFGGCCRPDAQCGINADAFTLGCVARADVPSALGGPLMARACVPKCSSDAYCQGFSDTYTCAEAKDRSRFCAQSCQRDQDCAAMPGNVCAIQNNFAENRVEAYCRKPFPGNGQQGDPCSKPDDCAHGTCVQDSTSTSGANICTQLCGGDLDCPGAHDVCATAHIDVPDKSTQQNFRICLNQ